MGRGRRGFDQKRFLRRGNWKKKMQKTSRKLSRKPFYYSGPVVVFLIVEGLNGKKKTLVRTGKAFSFCSYKFNKK